MGPNDFGGSRWRDASFPPAWPGNRWTGGPGPFRLRVGDRGAASMGSRRVAQPAWAARLQGRIPALISRVARATISARGTGSMSKLNHSGRRNRDLGDRKLKWALRERARTSRSTCQRTLFLPLLAHAILPGFR